ncbi:hypothetical protein Nepgr_000362 [Nepenthes gracilis]|uniref:Uncharacterized protein n=1 Tax=Nepenthes gracilis TaxID=150966 RepID=A0AAD3P547_NEPGR|nr:hypothetical protein Nepgr_000362 [Nepenthes gracilis]
MVLRELIGEVNAFVQVGLFVSTQRRLRILFLSLEQKRKNHFYDLCREIPMTLMNLMEDKLLNFDQPLLSVRRGGPSTATLPNKDRKMTNNSIPCISHLPYYKSELKSGPVTNPGAVPFRWEQIPGTPKDDSKPHAKALEPPLLAPKLPPGRSVNHIPKALDMASKDSCSSKTEAENDPHSPPDFSSLDKNSMEPERSEEEVEENRYSTEDEDSIYVDALDVLSHRETFVLNCSVSGVSGLDGPDMKPSRTFSDPQTRDFMMGRFLPAAKAVASEMPQFPSRKQPKLVKKVMTWDLQSSRYPMPATSLHYTRDKAKGENEEDDDDEEEDYDGTKNLSAKACGLFPRFCLLNPIPGIRDKGQVPISSVHVGHKNPASVGSYSKIENKENRTAVHARKPIPSLHKSEVGDKADYLKCELNTITSGESSVQGHLVGNGIAPYRNALPHSFFHEEKGFLGIPEEAKVPSDSKHHPHKKGYRKIHEFLADQNTDEELDGANSTIEKTLYIDSVQKMESQNLNSSSSESRGTADSVRTAAFNYSLQDALYLCGGDEKAMSQSKNLDIVDCISLALDKSGQEMQNDRMNKFQLDKDLNLDFNTSACLKQCCRQELDVNVQQLAKTDAKETSNDGSPPLLLPPPLPKSPSESWLSRTLPHISSRNPSSRSHTGIQLHWGNTTSQPARVDSKWETIIESSMSQHRHFRPPVELAPISEN